MSSCSSCTFKPELVVWRLKAQVCSFEICSVGLQMCCHSCRCTSALASFLQLQQTGDPTDAHVLLFTLPCSVGLACTALACPAQEVLLTAQLLLSACCIQVTSVLHGSSAACNRAGSSIQRHAFPFALHMPAVSGDRLGSDSSHLQPEPQILPAGSLLRHPAGLA